MNEPNEDLMEPPYSFRVMLTICHPSLPSAEISNLLELRPTFSQSVGTKKTAPNGAKIGGINKRSVWIINKEGPDTRFFFSEVERTLEYLENRSDVLLLISETGGTLEIAFQLNGKENIGDIIKWGVLGRMATLKLDLGIEVFP